MHYKFLYIDDEEEKRLKPLIKSIEDTSFDIEIMLEYPEKFEEQLKILSKDGYDGFIFDWRLDEVKRENKQRPEFRAGSLAQEIRTRASETHRFEKPIILLSGRAKLENSYNKDLTSQDLFDLIYVKEEIKNNHARIAEELTSLVNGYNVIIEIRKKAKKRNPIGQACSFLNISEKDAAILDDRLINFFERNRPAHEYAQFILRDLIENPGPLIDELYLAARLGIDIEKSKDWNRLKAILSKKIGYTGPFHEAWPRWWNAPLQTWWDTLENCLKPLNFLKSDERVAFLKKVTRLTKLTSAQPLQPSYSSKFWTICQVRKKPLDQIDAFIIESRASHPWQEKKYVSKIAVLEREHIANNLSIHPLDREKYKEFLKQD